MRLRRMTTAVLAVGVLAPATAPANGLLYKLPADGAKTVYAMKMTANRGGAPATIDGTLSIASVGTEKVDDKACRWIEFQMKMEMQGRSRTITAKLLIPEASLGKGKTPLPATKKGWLKSGDREAKALDDPTGNDGGPLPAFLPGPLKDVSDLKAKKIKTPFGELVCRGLTGTTTYKQRGETKVTYETRLSDKSPTGVASCKMSIQETRDGVSRDVATLELSLKKVVKSGAKSALPDSK
ncbi:MAG: hypothetical protein ACE5KM_11135 [Planctomycetaceae bacterium]